MRHVKPEVPCPRLHKYTHPGKILGNDKDGNPELDSSIPLILQRLKDSTKRMLIFMDPAPRLSRLAPSATIQATRKPSAQGRRGC